MSKELARCAQQRARLTEELDRWLAQSRRLDPPGPQGGGEDEANYALAWIPHYLLTRRPAVREHLQSLLAGLAAWVQRECYHGYRPSADAHHGPEPFVLFLCRYLGLFPTDETARKLLKDVVHHLGNWAPGIPAWYDYQRDVFRSYHLGTRQVSDDPRFAYQAAEHFRFLHLALAAYRVFGEQRYAQWAWRYGRGWAERLLAVPAGPLPVLWDLDGRPLYPEDLHTPTLQNLGAAHHHAPGDPLAGVENLLASGAVTVFADLYRLQPDPLFPEAARRIVEPLVASLPDPYADPGAAALSAYRRAFGDSSLDEALRAQVRKFPPPDERPLVLWVEEQRTRRDSGVGRRNDMVRWGHWTEAGFIEPTHEPSPAALTLAYQLTGEVTLARRALEMAARRLALARRVLRGGREHADMGAAICSVAAGHGRNWGVGSVTGCYGPLLLGTEEVYGATVPLLEVEQVNGEPLPSTLLTLVRPFLEGGSEVLFYNQGAEAVALRWRWAGEGVWTRLELAPTEVRRFQGQKE
ncbi:MAG TPA: hypothetical protein EYP85_02975 [Armatimonadetes bacterium]|nr:hypothetical protein [Armatimonadota bacterium]